jgi:hypothetical protein
MRAKGVPWFRKRRLRGAALDARALLKRALSFRKASWSLSDYPVRLRKQDVTKVTPWSDRAKMQPWVAQVINWYGISGGGATRAEAYADLSAKFDAFRETHETLPRPGERVPLQFAPRDLIDAHRELAEDFIVRVLDVGPGEKLWLSNESSLWNFPGPAGNEEYFAKIELLYGVDVSNVEGAKIGLILEEIAAHRARG